jgi:hypothetical protein
MPEKKPFNAKDVADISAALAKAIGDLDAARNRQATAERETNHASVIVSNLRTRLTNAVNGQLDTSSLERWERTDV